ncbi:hypothetical protein GCM10011613_29990 [Cellvibrio zantedeschiae]|uniref:DUF4345 domain-containing protein n=1 Tax=Cellvibrio zantedeschiae TaxID=1237077 RepID=A0ABQ3B7U5_9GAMM|nr:hypothetical protein [Cellvibrio zantedeschiae]GGY83128.1 hypothetical protein GCM10011613_29990 [Cellvibrio zantedeschiae]
MIGFKALSIFTAALALILFLSLLFVPEPIFFIFQLTETGSAFFIARRAAMLFLGIAILSWLGRAQPHSQSRQSICMGLGVMMLGLACLGLFEYLRGFAGPGIGLAVITEAIIGVAYLKIWFVHRQ